MTQRFGTPYYIAPEVLKGEYNEKCDIWSLGVMLYIMLSGIPPFNGQRDEEIYNKVRLGKFHFNQPVWNQRSEASKDLIRKMLIFNPEERATASACLSHAWIKKEALSTVDEGLNMAALSNLKNFQSEHKLQQAAMTFIVNQLLTQKD